MKKDFFRKVAFGLSPNEKINEDPLNWAKQQFDTCLLYTSDAADE